MLTPNGYIDEQEAIASKVDRRNERSRSSAVKEVFRPTALKAWVVVVQPISATDSTETVTYYSGWGSAEPNPTAAIPKFRQTWLYRPSRGYCQRKAMLVQALR